MGSIKIGHDEGERVVAGTGAGGDAAHDGDDIFHGAADLDTGHVLRQIDAEGRGQEQVLKGLPYPELAQALDGADAIIFAVPSTHLRDVCHQAAPYIADETPVLCLTKGIEPESGLLMSEVIASEIGNEARVAALSGPNHAEEICHGGLSAG